MSLRKLLVVSMIVLIAGLAIGGMALGQEKIVLKVLYYRDASNPGAQREIDEIWEPFNVAHPNIIVEREDLFGEPFHQKTEAYAAAGMFPDIVYMWPGGRSSTIHNKKLVKDLTPLLGEEVLSEFIEPALAPQANGYLAELPIGMTSSHAFYVNHALLAELGLTAPETYEDLKAMVPVLKEAGKDVILLGAQDDWVLQSCLYSMIVGRLLGDEYVDKLVAGEAKFTDEPFVNTLRFYQSLYDDGIISPKIMQIPYNDVNSLFAKGQAPFLIDGDWKAGDFLTDETTGDALISPEDQENIEITVFPAIPGEIDSKTSSVVVGCGFGISSEIPDGSPKEEAAVKLLLWLQSAEAQKIRLESGASTPSRKGVTSDNLEPMANAQVLLWEKIEKGTYVIDDVLDAVVYGPINVGLQEIGLGVSTPERVAANTQRAYEEWREDQ